MIRRTLDVVLGSTFMLFGLFLLAGIVWAISETGRWSYALGAFLALLALKAGWSRVFPSAYEPIAVDPDDPLFVAAAEQARREFGRFRRCLRDGGKQAYVKFPAKTESGAVEQIWALAHSIDGELLTVTIVNEPVGRLEDERPRQVVRAGEIEDWMLVDGAGNAEGGFSHLAMAKKFRQERGYLPSAMKRDLRRFKDLDTSGL